MTQLRIFTGRQVLFSSREVASRGGFSERDGVIEELFKSQQAVEQAAKATGAEVVDLGELVLVPGLVNAHAHLELSDMRGRVSPAGRFPDWIRALITARGELGEESRAASYEAGALELARSGCTLVADIDSCGLASAGSGERFVRVIAYREALDIGDAGRRESLLASLKAQSELRAVSPHSPYTTSPELLSAVATLATDQELALGVHWAETPEESEWMEQACGPFAALLGSDSPRRPGLELLRTAGLLSSRLALYHANHPTPSEIEQVKQSGASVVHCPGTHAFFNREPFPLAAWREAGVNLALGTDSLASNDDLSMLREQRLMRESFPELPADECFRMATENGAAAMGLAREAGQLRVGSWADFAGFEAPVDSRDELLEALTTEQAAPRGTWIGGERVDSPEEA